jgi:ribosomal protein S15P/S13E
MKKKRTKSWPLELRTAIKIKSSKKSYSNKKRKSDFNEIPNFQMQQPIFKKHKIQIINIIVNKFKIKNHLESTKNKKDNKSKSGMYKITCGTRRCGFKYIGQSRRAIHTRFTEHLRAFKNNHPQIRCS